MDGVTLRVEQGKKHPEDRRMDIFVGGQWRPIHMSLGCILADFFGENEDVLYPRAQGFAGGNYYLRAMEEAQRSGWEAVSQRIQQEREEAEARRNGVPAPAPSESETFDQQADLDRVTELLWGKDAA